MCRPTPVASALRWAGFLENAMTVAPSPLLTGPETARYLGIKPQTLRKWRLTGHGPPFVRIGDSPRSRVAYRLSDIEAWVAARTFASTAAETVARWGAD
jgi:predicted DNA-binding transcriptional regulator AlpA